MRLFQSLYERTISWAGHRHAERYLSGLSFAESSFFPIPPDVMLAPMCIASPEKSWRFAFLTTVFSVLGGLLGYAIGYLSFDLIEPLLHEWGKWHHYEKAVIWFNEWGIWAVFIAGFAPIPYKVFTIAAGAASMAILPFVLASLVGRGLRFYLVAGLMRYGGKRMEPILLRYVEILGWLLVVVLVIGYFVYSA